MTSVTAIIVTRGDVDLDQVIGSLPRDWEVILWNNGVPEVQVYGVCRFTLPSIKDLSVYGRYAAIEHASHDLIYVQDDDCIVSDPQAIVNAWMDIPVSLASVTEHGHNAGVVCNMPSEFRHDFYTDHALVGFGAAFHRDAPERAFARFQRETEFLSRGPWESVVPFYRRTCDIVFTALTPRVLVDVPLLPPLPG